MKTFHLGIKVTVTGYTDEDRLAPLVNNAVQELVNRADFRGGTIADGRVLTHKIDFNEVNVTVDIYRHREDTDEG